MVVLFCVRGSHDGIHLVFTAQRGGGGGRWGLDARAVRERTRVCKISREICAGEEEGRVRTIGPCNFETCLLIAGCLCGIQLRREQGGVEWYNRPSSVDGRERRALISSQKHL